MWSLPKHCLSDIFCYGLGNNRWVAHHLNKWMDWVKCKKNQLNLQIFIFKAGEVRVVEFQISFNSYRLTWLNFAYIYAMKDVLWEFARKTAVERQTLAQWSVKILNQNLLLQTPEQKKRNECAVDMDVDFVVISRGRVRMCFDYDLCIQYVEIILFKPKSAQSV